ncbi:uncharacterized protein ARB_02174 [Trichophyton benhamiae CBS 112371]|uniref:Altered inheritance of mitochondria protein 9, mitochondrial n=1 Tax=Arthroderma benhamiae (strain ATCC MYA-4681 / CBS 112371) TaxID=663331 RepID=D4B145_ARTBC|nr:uncharacterized protein ARB_02174 [Trichophyton benhamiae CBS 112371]EFE30980.1 hypothetical protein ARB_02174 [Trichophyton benhamiae CBS 112371]
MSVACLPRIYRLSSNPKLTFYSASFNHRRTPIVTINLPRLMLALPQRCAARRNLIRTFFHHEKTRQARSISITCRGKPIGEEELFKYTNGRFLINEEQQLQKRYLKFDVPRLCAVAAAAGPSTSPIVSISKMEGGFCKALLMRKADGTEVVAKLPSRVVGPARDSTSSEVATLKYVPDVFAWNSDASNDVGREYIILEKAPGIQLYKKWGSMNGTSKLALVRSLVDLERQLAAIHFPVSGSLYLRESAISNHCQPLCKSLDPDQRYCIGPSAERSWNTLVGSSVEHHSGPCRYSVTQYTTAPNLVLGDSLSEYGTDLARREITRISSSPARDYRPYNHQHCADEEITDLKNAMTIFKTLESRSADLASISRPTLWHTDLHMGNIFVSDNDPTEIVSIIDWQYIAIGPLFLQANWPSFLKPGDEYIYGPIQPQLPHDFEELGEAEKRLASSIRDDAIISKSYELQSFLHSQDVYRSLNLPTVFRELFVRCGESNSEGTICLRVCLAELYQSWAAFSLTGECPVSFSSRELEKIEGLFQEYRNWHDVQEFARSYLETDADGWVSPELSFSEIQQRNRHALERYVKEMAHYMPLEAARKMWPFPDEC